MYEGGAPYELSWRFATVGEHRFDGALTGAMTAHPKIDPIWDELCYFGYATEPPYLTYGVVSPRGQISRTIPIDLPRPVLMHDFAVTDQHVVFFDCPAVLDVSAAATGATARAVAARARHADRGAPPRGRAATGSAGSRSRTASSMHVLNAYTDGDEVIVDYVHRPSFALGTALGVQQTPTLHRLVIELGRGPVSDEMFDPMPVEFPRIDDRRVGLRHRYGYLAALTHGDGRPEGVGFDTIVRYDLRATSSCSTGSPRASSSASRSSCPRRDSLDEGDGWVLALTYDVVHDRSELVVLDAQEIEAPPCAVVKLPRRVPAGLHGTWLPGREPEAPRRSARPT